VISSFDASPKVLGPMDVTEHGNPRVRVEAQVSYNVGVTNVAAYAFPRGTIDRVGQALQGIGLVEGNAQNGKWRGIYALWSRDAPDGEYELYVRARDAANFNYSICISDFFLHSFLAPSYPPLYITLIAKVECITDPACSILSAFDISQFTPAGATRHI
jgi:hypothetical protein